MKKDSCSWLLQEKKYLSPFENRFKKMGLQTYEKVWIRDTL
jgi:hypothetical protein